MIYDYLIIGAGVIGASVARVLSRYDCSVVVLESRCDVAMGATGANSGILHAGHDCESGTLMAKFNVEGNVMFDRWAEELDVPIARSGTLVLAFDESELPMLEVLRRRGLDNGLTEIEIISAEKVKELEPNVSDNVVAALWTPTGGMINPYELNVALMENARDNGVEFCFNTEVDGIEFDDGVFHVLTKGRSWKARKVINCAGVYADKIAKMVGDESFQIVARRGEYVIFDRPAVVNRPLFQVPTALGKGVLVSPTVDGNFFIGPSAQNIDDKGDTSVTVSGIEAIKRAAHKSIKDIPLGNQISSFTGLRAVPSSGDFVIGEFAGNRAFVNVSGICSPGLTSAPAIAEYVVKGFGLREKDNYNPIRKRITPFRECGAAERERLIAKDKRYANIVCRCELVTEAEIVEAVKRGATTVDGVKRRTRSTMGRCQGSFCVPKVLEVLARELGVPMEQVTKHGAGSEIVRGDIRGDDNGFC